MLTQQKNLQLIQMLRGIACMLVVLYHITINSQVITGHIILGNIFKFGSCGVDIFFVLSGFIITYSNLHNIAQPSASGNFLKRRLIRIFPIYWLIITIFLILQLAFPAFYITHFKTSFANVLQTYLLLPNHIMLNGVSWSLTNELFFYLLFMLAFIIPNKKYSLFLLIAYFIFLIVFSITAPVVTNVNPYIGMLFFPMNIEFFLGVFIVIIIERLSKKWIYPLLVSGILLFLTGAFLSNNGVTLVSSSSNLALNRVLLFGLPSFLIILALVKMELGKTINMHNIFLHLGDASYSIYLIHLPIVVAFFKIVIKFNINNVVHLSLCIFVLLFTLCAAGIFIFHKIEKPLIRKLTRVL